MRISDWSSDVCSSDLLAFARRQPLHPTYTAVNARIDECRALLRRTLGAEVEIERTLSEDIWPVVVDGSQLENALLNLAINARDAMPNGGKLIIETGNVTLDRESCDRNPNAVPGQHVMISVKIGSWSSRHRGRRTEEISVM